MKRFFTLITMITVAHSSVFAQSATEPLRWEFGAMLGSQLSLMVPRQDGTKPVVGILAGADIGYRFQDAPKGWSVHLQPYFTASRSTGKSGGGNSDIYIELRSKFRSVNAPLFVRYTFLNGKIRPFAELGAHVAVRSTVSTKILMKECPPGMTCEVIGGEDRRNNINDNRVTALASAGIQIDAGKVTIPVTVRLIENLKKLETYDFGGVEYKFPKSRVIQLTAGMMF